MVSDPHDPKCRWPQGPPCRKFSTDGTLMGAEIAHTMGTTDEKVIAQLPIGEPFASDVDEEQRDWEADEPDVQSCGLKHPPTRYCGPGPHQEEPMRPYPASNCDWS